MHASMRSLEPDVGISSIWCSRPARSGEPRIKDSMNKPISYCKIVYVRRSQATGWAWQPVAPEGEGKASAEVYGLFYDCVVAARMRGYTPATPLKCS